MFEYYCTRDITQIVDKEPVGDRKAHHKFCFVATSDRVRAPFDIRTQFTLFHEILSNGRSR